LEGVQTQTTNNSSHKMPSYEECATAIKLPSCQGDLFVWQRKGAIEMYEYIARHFGH
jgi:hypothetical protein